MRTTEPLTRAISARLAALVAQHGPLVFEDRPGTARMLGGPDARPHHLKDALANLSRQGLITLREHNGGYRQSSRAHNWQADRLTLISRADLAPAQDRRRAEGRSGHLTGTWDGATSLCALLGPDPKPRPSPDFASRFHQAMNEDALKKRMQNAPTPGQDWTDACFRPGVQGQARSLMLGNTDRWSEHAWQALAKHLTVDLRARTEGAWGQPARVLYSGVIQVTSRRARRPGMLRVSLADARKAQRLGHDLERDWDNHEIPTLQVRLSRTPDSPVIPAPIPATAG